METCRYTTMLIPFNLEGNEKLLSINSNNCPCSTWKLLYIKSQIIAHAIAHAVHKSAFIKSQIMYREPNNCPCSAWKRLYKKSVACNTDGDFYMFINQRATMNLAMFYGYTSKINCIHERKNAKFYGYTSKISCSHERKNAKFYGYTSKIDCSHERKNVPFIYRNILHIKFLSNWKQYTIDLWQFSFWIMSQMKLRLAHSQKENRH